MGVGMRAWAHVLMVLTLTASVLAVLTLTASVGVVRRFVGRLCVHHPSVGGPNS